MIKDCLGITDCYYPLSSGEYYIYDDHVNNKPNFANDSQKWNLKLINESDEEIHFYQNDGCLMKQNELKKCDWLCFNDIDFYFIEAKDVKLGKRKQARKDAIEQFEQTIPFILELCPAIKKMKLAVVLNFKNNTKLTSASRKEKQAYFKERYSAKYLEQNFIEF